MLARRRAPLSRNVYIPTGGVDITALCTPYLQQNYSGHHQSNSSVTGVGTTHGAAGGAKTYRMDDGVVEQFYRSNNHSERIMRKMELYHNKQELCDVVLVAGQRRIPAHRIVLSAASDYFAAMFTSDCREANEKEVIMQNIDSEALTELIQYMYTDLTQALINKISDDTDDDYDDDDDD
ncbi:hypothetical protein LSH36_84g06012 [Paralvinella palmiformis]|uniref:BTB domain-containing protein n=1 Tax=Paralvinella palmiformis TaxID=53620 RepID=A0AAD9NDH0_9ANNE|nr:hypothetical protein LSH36_84g06012 [Paralvinella palmiformis]